MRSHTLFALVAVATLPRLVSAQFTVDSLGPATRSGEPRFQGGIAFVVGQPVHEFRRYVANGFGGTAHGLYRIGSSGAFALRLDGGLVNYGSEKKRIPWNDNVGRISVDLKTQNNIFWGGIGPQLMAPRGMVRPYATGSIGFAVFNTTSSIDDRETGEEIISNSNQTDGTWAASGAGGFLIPLSRSVRSLVFLDIGARYHRNGRVTYLREGGITDLPGGQVRYDTIRSDGDLWTYHIGVSIGGR